MMFMSLGKLSGMNGRRPPHANLETLSPHQAGQNNFMHQQPTPQAFAGGEVGVAVRKRPAAAFIEGVILEAGTF